MIDNVSLDTAAQQAGEKLDAHLRDMVHHGTSSRNRLPFLARLKAEADWDPIAEIKSVKDLQKFPHFQDEWLRDRSQQGLRVPKEYEGRPFNIFETGGTTGMPKQRIGWDDFRIDYSEFSNTLNDEHFPKDHYWLMIGPTGPRRLRLAIEHLANVRGCSCYCRSGSKVG